MTEQDTTQEENNTESTDTTTEEVTEENQDGSNDGGENTEEKDTFNPEDVTPEVRNTPKEGDDAKDDTEDPTKDLEEDDVALVGKVVDKKLKPLRDQLEVQTQRAQKLADEADVDSHIRTNPEMAKYRAGILKYMAHPAYSNIPVSNIASIVSSKDQQKLGAQKEREANDKVDESKGHDGENNRGTGDKGFDWSTASKEQVTAKQIEVMGRPAD